MRAYLSKNNEPTNIGRPSGTRFLALKTNKMAKQKKKTKMDERVEWVVDYALDKSETTGSVDITNTKFVDAYIAKFNPTHVVQPFGANTCPQLGRVLSECHKRGRATRSTIGLHRMEVGFPKWVYVYTFG